MQFAALQFQLTLGQRKTKAGAFDVVAWRGADLLERLLDTRDILLRDLDPCICDRDVQSAASIAICGKFDAPARRGELDRIGQQVQHDLARFLRVGIKRQVAFLVGHGNRNFGGLGKRPHHVVHGLDQFVDLNFGFEQIGMTGFDLR